MPYFTITTSFALTGKEKEYLISSISDLTVSELSVAPDKVQVYIQEGKRANFGRAGVSLENKNFSLASRYITAASNQSYYSGKDRIEDLIVIELDIWHNFSVEEKSELSKNITNLLKTAFSVSGDNILILIRDMDPANWIQNGISGVEKDFLNKSREV